LLARAQCQAAPLKNKKHDPGGRLGYKRPPLRGLNAAGAAHHNIIAREEKINPACRRNQQLVGTSQNFDAVGIAPTTKPKHSSAPLVFRAGSLPELWSTIPPRLRRDQVREIVSSWLSWRMIIAHEAQSRTITSGILPATARSRDKALVICLPENPAAARMFGLRGRRDSTASKFCRRCRPVVISPACRVDFSSRAMMLCVPRPPAS